MLRIGTVKKVTNMNRAWAALEGFTLRSKTQMCTSQCWKQRSGLGTLKGRPGPGSSGRTHQGAPRLSPPHSSTPDFICVLTATDAPLAQVRPPKLEGGALQHFQCIGATATEAGELGPLLFTSHRCSARQSESDSARRPWCSSLT